MHNCIVSIQGWGYYTPKARSTMLLARADEGAPNGKRTFRVRTARLYKQTHKAYVAHIRSQ